MIVNYFTVMLRHMRKHALHSSINILGLTAGIAFALLIGVFIRSEMLVNQDLKEVDDLYLLETEPLTDGPQFFTPLPLLPKAKEMYPGVVTDYYRFWDRNITVSKDDKHLRIQSMIGDPTLIALFGFNVVAGDASTALARPNTIVLTRNIAEQFFGDVNVVGETLTVASEGTGLKNYEVTAVIEDPQKKNTVTDLMNMNAQVFLSMENRADFSLDIDMNSWDNFAIGYVRINNKVAPAEAADVLQGILKTDAPVIEESSRILLKPLADYYQLTNHGAVRNLMVSLSWIVGFILLLAVANFVNISISGSFKRLKEIGVRKAIGGIRQQLMVQCLMESTVLAIASGVLALLLYQLLHGYFGVMLGATLPSVIEFSRPMWMGIWLAVVCIGILAGSYPAFYLSATRTIESLKGKFRSVSGTIGFSRTLIGLQFAISIFILASALIISFQIDYFLNKDLGYDRSSVLVVSSAPRWWSEEGLARMEVAKRELQAAPVVESVSLSLGSPAAQFGMGSVNVRRAGQPVEEAINFDVSVSDEDFAKVYGLTMLEGRFLADENGSRVPSGVVINQAAQKALQLERGDKVLMDGNETEYTVVGVMKDFNYETFHKAVKPVVIVHTRDAFRFRFYSFKLRPGDLSEAVTEVERAWRKAFPDEAFMAMFADERVQMQYQTELNLRRASSIGSVLMMIIVLTGVLGLVSLTVAKRNKEMGIRKVLGASVANLLSLLAREYVVVMMLAFATGLPASYWFINDWLSTFVYRIDLSWWMFVLPAVGVFLLTVLVVAGRGFGAAVANPVKSLRYE